MDGLLTVLPSWAAAGTGAGAGFFMVKWFFEWLGGRVDKREAAVDRTAARVDATTQTLIHNLEDRMTSLTSRLDLVETELKDCRDQHAKCEAELAQLRGLVHGLGDAKQTAQVIVAADRLADRKGNQ